MAEKKKDGGKEATKKPLIQSLTEGLLGFLVKAGIFIALCWVVWLFVKPTINAFRLRAKAENMASEFATKQRSSTSYHFSVFPENSPNHLVIRPNTTAFSIEIDRAHVGQGIKLVVEVNGYRNRRYVIDVDNPTVVDLSAVHGGGGKKYPASRYDEYRVWLHPDCAHIPHATAWVVKDHLPPSR